MTELLKRALTEINKLSDREQNEIASRILAELNQKSQKKARIPGIDQGVFVVPDDFNDYLPQEIIQAFEGDI
jgi:hypothetical protein